MTERYKYGAVAIAIHWATALFIITNLVLGHVMEGAPMSSRFLLISLHIWIGLSVLLLTVLRIVWRLSHPKPAYADPLKPHEARLAGLVQMAFYGLLLALPLLGYLLVSANAPNPARHLTFWGVVPVPFLGYLQHLDRPLQVVVHDQLVQAHALAAWLMVGTLALHLAGVAKHMVIDRINILKRMSPFN